MQSALGYFRVRLLFLVLLSVLPALAIIVYSAAEQRRHMRIAVENEALQLARSAANFQRRRLEQAYQLLFVLARTPTVMAGNPAVCSAFLAELQERYPHFASVGVADSSGAVTCSGSPTQSPTQLGDKSQFERAIATGDFAMGEYQSGPAVAGTATLGLAYPIPGAGGRVQRVVFAALDPSWPQSFAEESNLPSGAELLMIDRNGTILAMHPPSGEWIGKSLAGLPLFRAIQRQPQDTGTFEAPGLNGVEDFFAFVRLRDLPSAGGLQVFLSMGLPRKFAYAEITRSFVRNLLLLGAAALAALIVASLAGQLMFTRRVNALRRATERLARGDLSARTGLEYKRGELDELAHSFDDMASSLEKRTTEAADLRDSLFTQATRAELLSEASGILASSPDFEVTVPKVATLVVSRVADGCIVQILEPGGAHTLAVAHADPEKLPLLEELTQHAPAEPKRTGVIAEVIRTGEPMVLSSISDEFLRTIADDSNQLRILRALEPTSAIVAPLEAGGEVLGALTIFTTSADRAYGDDDLLPVMELANRIALAIRFARLYEAARAASKAKSDFLAVMSHELRTPLNVVTGNADLLDAGIGGALNEKQAHFVDRIKAGAWSQLRVIDEILTYSRMESGREAVHLETVDLTGVAQDAASVVRPQAEEKGLVFLVHVPTEPTEFRTDPAKVRHILLDLLLNAVKFTEKGEVELTLQVEDGAAVFRVRDTGIGIAPENQEKIFEPFFQVEEAMTREKGGTGLGLAVARRLARMLGGDIAVESAVGRGSTFIVRLPRNNSRI